MTDTNYNGYRNYQTWNIALWINNDQGTQEYYQEMVKGLTNYEAVQAISESIKFDNNPLLNPDNIQDASMYSDILSNALNEVDWLEVVEAIRPEA